MSDALCVGVCMIDWDTGVCLGCGRTSEEIAGVPVAPVSADESATQAAKWSPPLPPNVASEVGEGSE